MPIPSLKWNTDWLDKTPNKDVRAITDPYVGVVWHETGSPAPDASQGTLNYNLDPARKSSYNVLIPHLKASGQQRLVYAYVSSEKYTAWHAGVRSAWAIPAIQREYVGYEINQHFLGIELDGTDQGDQAPPWQLDTAALVAIAYYQRWKIPLLTPYHTSHKAVAPGYKHDPTCTTVEAILDRAYQWLWGTRAPYNRDFGIPQLWRREINNFRPLGEALTDEQAYQGGVTQTFQWGVIRWANGQGTVARS